MTVPRPVFLPKEDILGQHKVNDFALLRFMSVNTAPSASARGPLTSDVLRGICTYRLTLY